MLNSGVNPAVSLSGERGVVGGTSSARRRREPRLRSWAQHERLSVAMALAEKLHHSANCTVLPKEEEVEQDYALLGQKSARAGPGTQFLFVGGVSVPEPVGEPQLQARVQRHTAEQRIEHTLYVQILDAPVPQKVEQLVDFFKDLDSHVRSCAGHRSTQDLTRYYPSALCGPRSADGGTVGGSADHPDFYSLQQQTAEQIVHTPDPVRERRIARLQGFLPEQSSTAQQFSTKRISDRIVEQIVDTRVFRGGSSRFSPRTKFIFVFAPSSWNL